MPANPLTCELCYAVSTDVTRALAWYADAKEPVQFIDRCRDHEACRARVEAKGERWPLSDSYDRALREVRA